MKAISKDIARQIADFSAETELSLPGYALEKDIHVVDAIQLIVALPENPHFRPVFCGGTCLSKAYGILDRMSEDVDFKVVPTDAAIALSTTALRKALSAYVKSIIAALEAGGFGANSVVRRSLDGNKYSALDVRYESAFDKPVSLRPHLLIELNHTVLAHATQEMSIGTLLDKLAYGAYALPFKVECVSMGEALAEKLVSFPRRLAMQLSKMLPGESLLDNGNWDKALVRHLYDVARICERYPELLRSPQESIRMVSMVIEKDAVEFANQHAAFAINPRKELLASLAWAKDSQELDAQYRAFVEDMVYAHNSEIPSYRRALLNFESTMLALLIGHPNLPA